MKKIGIILFFILFFSIEVYSDENLFAGLKLDVASKSDRAKVGSDIQVEVVFTNTSERDIDVCLSEEGLRYRLEGITPMSTFWGDYIMIDHPRCSGKFLLKPKEVHKSEEKIKISKNIKLGQYNITGWSYPILNLSACNDWSCERIEISSSSESLIEVVR